MKRTLVLVFVSVMMLTGCYTSVCPTYTEKPHSDKNLNVQHENVQGQQEMKKAS